MRRVEGVIVGVGLSLIIGARLGWAETGVAELRGTAQGSTVSGSAGFTDTPNGLQITVRVSGASPGKHGLHIHEFGACSDGGRASGNHYNPMGVPHGFLPNDGMGKAHAGDFGNITVGPDGVGTLDLTIPGLTLSGGKFTVGGRAVILHEKTDDFGQPNGNAGSRIACGVIHITGN